jgi:cytochrome subunit of sulfide dehydrogenase
LYILCVKRVFKLVTLSNKADGRNPVMSAAHRMMVGSFLLGCLLVSAARSADVGTLARPCEDCHGKNGVSQSDDVPTIAGISAPVHGDFLLGYQEKARPCRSSKFRQGDTTRPETDMCAVAAKLSQADIEALAAHFAAQAFVPAKQPFDPAKAAAGKTLHARDCAKCHSDGGRDPDDDASILGGQHAKYLQQALADLRSSKREPGKKMGEKLKPLTDAEVETLIHYYASLQ